MKETLVSSCLYDEYESNKGQLVSVAQNMHGLAVQPGNINPSVSTSTPVPSTNTQYNTT